MIRWFVLGLVLAATGCKSDRERDCEVVREALAPPKSGDMPRRYDTYSPDSKRVAEALAESPLQKLAKLSWHDAEIAAAVKDLTADTGWTAYTPYSTTANTAVDKLVALCAK